MDGVSLGQRVWRRLCRLLVAIFYRRREIGGLDHLPREGAVILCANHVNALADAVVVQASCPRPIHPLARSGLFRNPLLRPLLSLMQAVPIYRRRADATPAAQNAQSNEDSFRRCHEYLADGRVLLIFPEGQSHSDPSLRALKTGAARLALGMEGGDDRLPTILPVGLLFPDKGRFRSHVLVQYGEPLDLARILQEGRADGAGEEELVRRVTAAIDEALRKVTLNIDSWDDLQLMRLLRRFFLRRAERLGGERESERDEDTLGRRFRALQRIDDSHRLLRFTHPEEIRLLRIRLERFEQLMQRHGVQDEHLNLRYTPALLLRFLARTLIFLAFVLPPALWGLLNSGVPYLATRVATHYAARGRDQYDTAGMLFGIGFFALFWSGQSAFVFWHWGWRAAALYALSLPLSALMALAVGRERRRILENARIFLLFARRRELQAYLRVKRDELDMEVARLARLARNYLARDP